MSFRCSGSDNLASAFKQSSAVEYFVSQLPDGQIGTHFTTAAKQSLFVSTPTCLCKYYIGNMLQLVERAGADL